MQSKNEPEWLLDFRLKAFKRWQSMTNCDWGELDYEPTDYLALSIITQHLRLEQKTKYPRNIRHFEKLGVLA